MKKLVDAHPFVDQFDDAIAAVAFADDDAEAAFKKAFDERNEPVRFTLHDGIDVRYTASDVFAAVDPECYKEEMRMWAETNSRFYYVLEQDAYADAEQVLQYLDDLDTEELDFTGGEQ